MKDGIRTRDRQGHNLELYQLSYLHHRQGSKWYHRQECGETPRRTSDGSRERGHHAAPAPHGAGAAYVFRTSWTKRPSLISRILSVCWATERSCVTIRKPVPSSAFTFRKSS